MNADGRESRIAAAGVIDLAAARIRGFGVGAARIVLVTPATIGFDSGSGGVERVAKVSETPRANRRSAAPDTTVQGSIDRLSGVMRIAVLSAAEPERVIIAMALVCTTEPAPG